jgi:hypothetical protein
MSGMAIPVGLCPGDTPHSIPEKGRALRRLGRLSRTLVEDPQLELAPAVEEFGAFYRLTAAERRVVLGLARGLTIEQISAGSGNSAGTHPGPAQAGLCQDRSAAAS